LSDARYQVVPTVSNDINEGDVGDMVHQVTSTSDAMQSAQHVPWVNNDDTNVDGAMPYLHEAPVVAMPMCVGYMPAVCYVMMPAADGNPVYWQAGNMMQGSQWQPEQSVQSDAYAPGVWNRQSKAGCHNGGASQRHRATGAGKIRATASDCSNSRSQKGKQEATTLILRNLPLECTRDVLLTVLDNEGFWGEYDFLHLPIDFQTKAGLGYALLNLVSHEVALRVQEHFDGFSTWPVPCDSLCEVAWNSPHQGLATHIDRYRNSPLMHTSVPETYRPVLFHNGFRREFPAPTTRIRAPRIRHQKPAALLA
jgi:hypothetical protein